MNIMKFLELSFGVRSGFPGSLISATLTIVALIEQGAIIVEDRCAQMVNAFRRTPRGTPFSTRVRADHESDSFCLPRSGRGSDKSVSVIVVPGWLQHSSVRGGAGVARFARSSWIWAGIIPQERRETASSPAIVDFVRFSDRSRALENGRDNSRADNETLRRR